VSIKSRIVVADQIPCTYSLKWNTTSLDYDIGESEW